MIDKDNPDKLHAVTVYGGELEKLLYLPCKTCAHEVGQHCTFGFDDEGYITEIKNVGACTECGCLDLAIDVDKMKAVLDVEERSEPATEQDLKDIERNSQ